MSVYRFKSRETGDLVMLKPHGQRLLEILGKDPAAPGVLLPQDMPRALLDHAGHRSATVPRASAEKPREPRGLEAVYRVLESEFGIKVKNEGSARDSFKSIATLADFVSSRLAQEQRA